MQADVGTSGVSACASESELTESVRAASVRTSVDTSGIGASASESERTESVRTGVGANASESECE